MCRVPSIKNIRAVKKAIARIAENATIECVTGMRFKDSLTKYKSIKCVLNSENDVYAQFETNISDDMCEEIKCPDFNPKEYNAEVPTMFNQSEDGKLYYQCRKNFKFIFPDLGANFTFQSKCVLHDDLYSRITLI